MNELNHLPLDSVLYRMKLRVNRKMKAGGDDSVLASLLLEELHGKDNHVYIVALDEHFKDLTWQQYGYAHFIAYCPLIGKIFMTKMVAPATTDGDCYINVSWDTVSAVSLTPTKKGRSILNDMSITLTGYECGEDSEINMDSVFI